MVAVGRSMPVRGHGNSMQSNSSSNGSDAASGQYAQSASVDRPAGNGDFSSDDGAPVSTHANPALVQSSFHPDSTCGAPLASTRLTEGASATNSTAISASRFIGLRKVSERITRK